MRIWDLPPSRLCRQHLLGEHHELHALWNVLTLGKSGYAMHPETLRWRGKLRALFRRHESLAAEMAKRGYNHGTPLPKRLARGPDRQRSYVHTPAEQRRLLKKKGCGCKV